MDAIVLGQGVRVFKYLHSIYNDMTDVYSLVKMREKEYDSGDNNDPGVTVCLISFNADILMNCIYNSDSSNKKELYNEIDRVVKQTGQTHSTILRQYFSNPASVASYNIAELYIRHVANSSGTNYISLPREYLVILEDIASYTRIIVELEDRTDSGSQLSVAQARAELAKLSRVPNYVESINQSAGYTVCDREKIVI